MDDITSWVIDTEADGLEPTKFYCLCAQKVDGSKVHTTSNYDDMRKLLTSAEVLIGHNISRWDIPWLEKLLGIKIKAMLIDTLAVSWYLHPEKQKHGLEHWGEELGVKKPEINNWFDLSQEEYEHRCEEDVKINWLLWSKFKKHLLQIYETQQKLFPFLKYLEFKMDCAREQERSRWKVDLNLCNEALENLLSIKGQKELDLIEAMPRVNLTAMRRKPKVMYKKDGTLSSHGERWEALLKHHKLPESTEEIEVITGSVEGNPNSHSQIKDWLFSLGWVPDNLKTDRDKSTGELRQIPQIGSKNIPGEVSESVKDLFELEPSLEALNGFFVINHRISVLKGFLENVDDEGYIKAKMAGFTNTLRLKHAVAVNLPKADRPYAKEIRGSLTVPTEDYILCGADMSSLEDRLKHSFIYPYDPKYVESMARSDYDPHCTIAVIAGMMNQEDMDFYTWYDSLDKDNPDNQKYFTEENNARKKRIKPIRDIAKNANYACQYGAGPPRIAITAKIPTKTARIVHEAYWKLNWAIKAVAKEQKWKMVGDQMWLFNPVSQFWYSLRFEKDIFSTLIQGTASYVFDKWVMYIRAKRPQLTAQFHDEIVLTVLKREQKEVDSLVNSAIDKLNKSINLNRTLGIGVQWGKRYSDIH